MTRHYLRDLLERVVATFCQGALGAVGVDALAAAAASGPVDVDPLRAALVGGVAALLSLIKGWAARRVGDPDSASLADGK